MAPPELVRPQPETKPDLFVMNIVIIIWWIRLWWSSDDDAVWPQLDSTAVSLFTNILFVNRETAVLSSLASLGPSHFFPPSLHIFPSPSQVLQVSINSKGSRQNRYKYDTTGWSPQITSLCWKLPSSFYWTQLTWGLVHSSACTSHKPKCMKTFFLELLVSLSLYLSSSYRIEDIVLFLAIYYIRGLTLSGLGVMWHCGIRFVLWTSVRPERIYNKRSSRT